LTLNPSSQQRIRIRIVLAQKLLAAGREAEAADNWRQLIAEAPEYPGIENIREALQALQKRIASKSK
jgi:cytochrome c-type biogenesis protein CcmH/NrfG